MFGEDQDLPEDQDQGEAEEDQELIEHGVHWADDAD